jgi:hypothetical protein
VQIRKREWGSFKWTVTAGSNNVWWSAARHLYKHMYCFSSKTNFPSVVPGGCQLYNSSGGQLVKSNWPIGWMD